MKLQRWLKRKLNLKPRNLKNNMKQLLLLSLFLFSTFFLGAQEMNFSVNVNTPKLQTADPKIFEGLKNDIRDFLNNTAWTSDVFSPEERIKCNIQLTISEELSPTTFAADLQIQAVRPIYGSNQETAIISHVDKDILIEYEQFQPLLYNRNAYDQNLTSILAFYVYMILGTDYDTFSPFGGEKYYQEAQNVITTIPPGVASAVGGWQSIESNRNRYWMLESVLSPRARNFRQALYDYHRNGLDLMSSSTDGAKEALMGSMEMISGVQKNYPQAMCLQMFANAKSSEIVEIFKQGNSAQKSNVIKIMSRIDAANAAAYRKIGR